MLAVVDAALTAVNTNDAALLQKVMLPTATIVAQNYGPDGKVTTRVISLADMVKGFAAPIAMSMNAFMTPVVLIQRDLAHVWAPYTLDYRWQAAALRGRFLRPGQDRWRLAADQPDLDSRAARLPGLTNSPEKTVFVGARRRCKAGTCTSF